MKSPNVLTTVAGFQFVSDVMYSVHYLIIHFSVFLSYVVFIFQHPDAVGSVADGRQSGAPGSAPPVPQLCCGPWSR